MPDRIEQISDTELLIKADRTLGKKLFKGLLGWTLLGGSFYTGLMIWLSPHPLPEGIFWPLVLGSIALIAFLVLLGVFSNGSIKKIKINKYDWTIRIDDTTLFVNETTYQREDVEGIYVKFGPGGSNTSFDPPLTVGLQVKARGIIKHHRIPFLSFSGTDDALEASRTIRAFTGLDFIDARLEFF